MTSKVVLVTGGSRGIGRGIVEAMLREGWRVAFCGRKPPEELDWNPSPDAAYFQSDIGVAKDREALLTAVLDRFGRLDALVNNAGVAPEVRADLLEMPEASFDRVLSINLKGPFFLTQLVANAMVKHRIAGTIINIGSISATVASVNRGEYCISKAGLAMATQLFAVRLAEYGILVYEIRPGIIATDMTGVVKEKYDKLIASGLTLQPRWGQPEDIGKAVASLLRGDFAYSTGQVFNVDGGLEVKRL